MKELVIGYIMEGNKCQCLFLVDVNYCNGILYSFTSSIHGELLRAGVRSGDWDGVRGTEWVWGAEWGAGWGGQQGTK